MSAIVRTLARWTGLACVYHLPGCDCTRSPEYMAFYRALGSRETRMAITRRTYDTGEPTPHIYLDLSTGVITQREMDAIEAAPVRVIKHEFGAWVHVPPVEPDGEDELSLDQPSGLEPEDERELAHLEAEFERGVGRGIAVAHRIDELRDLRDLGEDWSEFRNLLMVLRAARERGANWVNLDGDAQDTIPGLPTFDW